MTYRIGDPITVFSSCLDLTPTLLAIIAESEGQPAEDETTRHAHVEDLDPASHDWHAENCNPAWCRVAAAVLAALEPDGEDALCPGPLVMHRGRSLAMECSAGCHPVYDRHHVDDLRVRECGPWTDGLKLRTKCTRCGP